MARLRVEDGHLVVKLATLEKIAAVRGGASVPLSDITALGVETRPYACLDGVRAPGALVKGFLAYGLWRARGHGRKQFVALHGSGPALRVDLGEQASFRGLLVTVDDPLATGGELASATGLTVSEPEDLTRREDILPGDRPAVGEAPVVEATPAAEAAPRAEAAPQVGAVPLPEGQATGATPGPTAPTSPSVPVGPRPDSPYGDWSLLEKYDPSRGIPTGKPAPTGPAATQPAATDATAIDATAIDATATDPAATDPAATGPEGQTGQAGTIEEESGTRDSGE